MRWAVHVASIGETGNAYRILVGETVRRRLLGRPKIKWEGSPERLWGSHNLLSNGYQGLFPWGKAAVA
jgi:hypothetical protein